MRTITVWEISIISVLKQVEKTPQRLSHYTEYIGKLLNTEGIKRPTPIGEVKNMERMNNLAINVYGWEKQKVVVY